MHSSGGKEVMVKLHQFACIAISHKPRYHGDLCVQDMSESAFVSISTCSGLVTVLAKNEGYFPNIGPGAEADL